VIGGAVLALGGRIAQGREGSRPRDPYVPWYRRVCSMRRLNAAFSALPAIAALPA
jgi:hypothetical protein